MAEANILFHLATRVINHTRLNLFLTGRAGTGQDDFSASYPKTTIKKAVVVAPTGVAAINAGGVTMHSFFQLPLGMYIADASNYFGDEYSGQLVVNRHSLFKNMRINKDKIALMRELELLIIDEVSSCVPMRSMPSMKCCGISGAILMSHLAACRCSLSEIFFNCHQ